MLKPRNTQKFTKSMVKNVFVQRDVGSKATLGDIFGSSGDIGHPESYV
jgi:hypothetical protein